MWFISFRNRTNQLLVKIPVRSNLLLTTKSGVPISLVVCVPNKIPAPRHLIHNIRIQIKPFPHFQNYTKNKQQPIQYFPKQNNFLCLFQSFLGVGAGEHPYPLTSTSLGRRIGPKLISRQVRVQARAERQTLSGSGDIARQNYYHLQIWSTHPTRVRYRWSPKTRPLRGVRTNDLRSGGLGIGGNRGGLGPPRLVGGLTPAARRRAGPGVRWSVPTP